MKKSKVIIVFGEHTSELEKLLDDGWSVQHTATFSESVSSSYGVMKGLWGMYVILTKEEKELTEEEVKAKLIEKGLKLWE